MARFFGIKKKESYVEDTQEEYLALNESEIVVNNKRPDFDVEVRVFVLDDYDNIRDILDTIREETTMCLIDIHLLRNKDPDELKRAVDKLKKTVGAVSGELIGFHENWVMAAPKNVRIHRNSSN